MVVICSLDCYDKSQHEKHIKYFNKYKFPLYTFQKWAIDGIIEGNHVLVTAPTGSGKSLPAEFALDFFCEKGKKVIYCSPIKALSNQKFYDFTLKYPNISIGLITGDIKTNPDADVLIMTTEILLNKLYQLKPPNLNVTINSSVSFDMDIETELACVIFDEIHMINDQDRGHVWENCIIMLPYHIQMVGLSATLDDPEKFAFWMENRANNSNITPYTKKNVYLSKKLNRTIPLTHYSFFVSNSSISKVIKDKSLREDIIKFSNKFHVIQDEKGKFNEDIYNSLDKYYKLFSKNNIRIKRNHVLNEVAKTLNDQNMLPAMCYVFSRKQVDLCAKELTVPLIPIDSIIPSIIENECYQIIKKLPNFKEYLHLPEYCNLISLMQKGIATHHSGMIPILREIVELMFMKGYIKFLFCTESVAIGLNLPVKTTIFTDINKHDGTVFRKLHGHEFIQASGRAGRLGIDPVGNVIHLYNLFRDVDKLSYTTMLTGKPQVLVSKFKFSYNLILNLMNNSDNDLLGFAKKSMITSDLDDKLKDIYINITNLNREIDNMSLQLSTYSSAASIIEEYIQMENDIKLLRNKKQKQAYKRRDEILYEYKNIMKERNVFENIKSKENELKRYEFEMENVNSYISTGIDNILHILNENGFILNNRLTEKGIISSNIREVPCLIFGSLININLLNNLSTIEMITLFSCFTNITINDDLKQINCNYKPLNEIFLKIKKDIDFYIDIESKFGINSGTEYDIHYDLIKYVSEWCICDNIDNCKKIISELYHEKGIFLGEFIKALMKIVNISNEMEKIANLTGNILLLSKLNKIPNLLMKYIVTNQSLYI